jgi:hypothetical protein
MEDSLNEAILAGRFIDLAVKREIEGTPSVYGSRQIAALRTTAFVISSPSPRSR